MKAKLLTLLLTFGIIISLAMFTTGCTQKTSVSNEDSAAELAQEDSSGNDQLDSSSSGEDDTVAGENLLAKIKFTTQAVENYGDEVTQALYLEVSGLPDAALQEKLNKELKDFCLTPLSSAEQDTVYNIIPMFEVVGGDLLSLRTYNTGYTEGAAYPVSSLRTRLYSLTTGGTLTLWDFIEDKNAFRQLVLDGKFGFIAAGVEEEMPEELKAWAYQKLAESIDLPEFGIQFYFGEGGMLNVWCEGENHATGDYWLFDIPVADLGDLATDRLLPIVEMMKDMAINRLGALVEVKWGS